MPDFTEHYLNCCVEVAQKVDKSMIDAVVDGLVKVRESEGRLFMLGVGGSAANCSHAVNDFRKLADIETYAPTDNVSELTARTNDEGWDTAFSEWLKGSRLRKEDALFVFSVGGGNMEKQVSTNLVKAVQYAKEVGASVYGIVGRDGGYTAEVADAAVIIPTVDDKLITPIAESFQAVVWHGIVSHPKIARNATKW